MSQGGLYAIIGKVTQILLKDGGTMYKLLLVTDREDLRTLFRDQIPWENLNCRVPYMASSPQEAIDLLNSKAIDAVGYRFFETDGMHLTKFLR